MHHAQNPSTSWFDKTTCDQEVQGTTDLVVDFSLVFTYVEQPNKFDDWRPIIPIQYGAGLPSGLTNVKRCVSSP